MLRSRTARIRNFKELYQKETPGFNDRHSHREAGISRFASRSTLFKASSRPSRSRSVHFGGRGAHLGSGIQWIPLPHRSFRIRNPVDLDLESSGFRPEALCLDPKSSGFWLQSSGFDFGNQWIPAGNQWILILNPVDSALEMNALNPESSGFRAGTTGFEVRNGLCCGRIQGLSGCG